MQSFGTIAVTLCRCVCFRSWKWGFYLVVLFLPVCASAQTPNPTDTGSPLIKNVTLNTDVAIKLRPAEHLSSGTIRVGDYVEFLVVEDVLAPDEKGVPQVVIAKDTIAFGRVIERNKKFTFLKKGAFSIRVESLRAIDGQVLKNPRIIRPNNYPPCPKHTSRIEVKFDTSEAKVHSPRPPEDSCIAGRVYSGTFFANLPSAIITAGAAAALVVVNDPTAKAAAAVTLVQQISTQPGLGNLLNGANAEIHTTEYFDLFLDKAVLIKVKVALPK